MRLLCLRHGQSEYNILRLCNDNPARPVHLTTLGRAQAEAAAQRLRCEPLERIFCSELPRTRETARIVGRHHRVPIQTRPDLNEIRSGCDGLPVETYFRAITHDRLKARVDDGETLLEHKARVLGFLEWLRAQAYDTVAVVAHEETLRVFAAYARNLSDHAMIGLQFANCEILEIEL
jgi:alpha-ribazole phosphatase